MNKINFDFEKNKIDYKWNVAILIHSFFPFVQFFLFNIFEDNLEFKSSEYNSVINNEKIKNENKDKISIYKSKDNNEDTDRTSINYKNKIKRLNEQNKKLNNKIKDLNKEKDDIKREKDILVNHIENLNKEKEELIKSRGKYSLLPIKPGEKIITINFVSIGNQDIVNFGLTCKNTDLFIREEERLYETFPKFKNENTYFQVNTREIKRFLTLDQNGIKDNDIINMFVNS